MYIKLDLEYELHFESFLLKLTYKKYSVFMW